jgi:hypothetical protein
MTRYYDTKEIKKALSQLKIKPEDGEGEGDEKLVTGWVDGAEAAKILTWRAKQDYEVDYRYDATSVRQHTKKDKNQKSHFPEGTVKAISERRNLYQVGAVFALPISPRRGTSRRGAAKKNEPEPDLVPEA